jgi:uncharacterized protein YkwD
MIPQSVKGHRRRMVAGATARSGLHDHNAQRSLARRISACLALCLILVPGVFFQGQAASLPPIEGPTERAVGWQSNGIAVSNVLQTERLDAPTLLASVDCPTEFEKEVVRLINEERASRGLGTLSIDVRLLEAARLHSEDMAGNDYFSHTSQDGRSFTQRINDAGYPWRSAGETIAAGYSTPAAVVQGWMNSSGHRAILLGSSYEHVGIGYAYRAGSTYGHYWTGDFASSRDAGEAPAGCGTFSDVPEDHWAFGYIEALALSGITEGYGDGTFRPGNPVTRAEMAVFLERGMRGQAYEPPSANGNVFDDVSQNYWAAAWIEGLYADGITSGCGSTPLRFCPEAQVTRAEMAVFLERAKNWPDVYQPPPAGGTIFQDVPKTYWGASWIECLYADGITSGCASSPLRYCPENAVTRAEMAVFLVRAFEIPLP